LAIMQRSLVPAPNIRLTGRRIDGAPVYEYVRTPGTPPLSVQRFSTDQLPVAGQSGDHAHAHDFLVLAYFERCAASR
jgi:AraC family transcriptional regulator, transcriptional activator of pobA